MSKNGGLPFNVRKHNSMTESVVEHLVWYHLGNLGGNRGLDVVSLASIYRQHFQQVSTARFTLRFNFFPDYEEVRRLRFFVSFVNVKLQKECQ